MGIIYFDGKECSFNTGETVLEAARKNGVHIPTLCYHKKLSPIGSCRVCMVEIEGADTPMASCTTEVIEGMTVQTNTEEVRELRRTAIRLMLVNHNLYCAGCAAVGNCTLQELAYEYRIEEHGFEDIPERYSEKPFASPLINYDPLRCVMCQRCIHACKEIKGINALSIIQKGNAARVTSDKDKCISCGECVHVCPVGALTQKVTAPRVRVNQMSSVRSTCPYCGVGCQINLRVTDKKVWAVTADDEAPPNYGSLCVKGRFGFEFIDHPDRLTDPLIKENGAFRKASWEEALSLAAEKLKDIKDKHGPDSIMGLTSARCTNEENYLFQKFMRAAVGTNNVDHCARL